jgi:hypothetical protein
LGQPTKRFFVLAKAMEFFVEVAELFDTNAGELKIFIIKKPQLGYSNGAKLFYQKE